MKNKFETFNNIAHAPLRVFNRVVMSFNIKEDFGQAVLEKYLENFDAKERAEMMMVTMLIKAKGQEAVRKEVTKDLVLEEGTGVTLA